MRNFLAVVAGLVVGMAVNMGLVLLNAYVLYPMPEGTDFQDPEQINAYIATLPTAAFFVVLAAHLGQAYFGGWVAARSGTRPMQPALIVGATSALGGYWNLIQLTEAPSWMWIEMPLYFVLAWVAGRGVAKRRAKNATK